MSIHLSEVYEYIDTHPVSSYPGSFQSMLDMVRYIYTTCNPIDNVSIRACFQSFDSLTTKLTLQEHDQVLDVVCDLCMEYEKAAFSHGILVGMALMTELNSIP